jgi:class 3 adenylate cyclase
MADSQPCHGCSGYSDDGAASDGHNEDRYRGFYPEISEPPASRFIRFVGREHREFVSRLATIQDGRIFKAGGDGFWIDFPSVTGAGLAAVAMQEELRRSQLNKGDDRLAMRIVITLGDVLSEEGDLFGDAVALADRIEALTLADQIYMSAAARLAVNQAEIRTALVDAFALKGFAEPVPVYRIEQTHHTQVIAGQYIVITDLNNFSKFLKPPQLTAVEEVLEWLLELVGQVCREFGGTTRFNSGDAYCLTFSDPQRAMAATERLAEKWELFNRSEHLRLPLGRGAAQRSTVPIPIPCLQRRPDGGLRGHERREAICGR